MNILTQKYSFFRRKFMVVYCFGQKFDAKVRSCIIIYKLNCNKIFSELTWLNIFEG